MNGRVPPHDLDAERSLLGGVLMDNEALSDVSGVVTVPDFYREAHGKIFAAMLALAEDREPVDRVTVTSRLKEQGTLEAIGGELFIEALDSTTPSAANLLYYAQIVREKALARRLIEAAHTILTQGYEQDASVSELLDDAERRILAVAEGSQKGSEAASARAVMRDVMAQVERDFERGEAVTGIPTGIRELDSMTAGFQPGDLVILAARPGQGKTTAGLCWADYVAGLPIGKARAVYFASMEMSNVALGKRQLAARARVSLQRIRNGRLIESDWAKMAKSAGEIAGAPIEFDDSRGLSALELRARTRRARRKWADTKTPLGLVVLDYLTLMREDEDADTKTIAVGRNCKRLKELAGELEVPLLCLAQLNRQNVQGGKTRRPVLSDLRDSGEIEQHTDTAIFLHHEGDPDDTNERPNVVEIIVEKQRNGAVGNVSASHVWEFCLIEDIRQGGARDWHKEQE